MGGFQSPFLVSHAALLTRALLTLTVLPSSSRPRLCAYQRQGRQRTDIKIITSILTPSWSESLLLSLFLSTCCVTVQVCLSCFVGPNPGLCERATLFVCSGLVWQCKPHLPAAGGMLPALGHYFDERTSIYFTGVHMCGPCKVLDSYGSKPLCPWRVLFT